MKRQVPGDVLELVVFRGERLLTLSLTLATPPEDTAWLARVGDADATVRRRLAEWLGQPGS
jgi:hypothetical protein